MIITTEEFERRIQAIQAAIKKQGLGGMMVYGDEYRKENLRYVSNFWPIFERSGCFIPQDGQPILAGAPEGERYAREMTIWQDVRNIKEFVAVSVPEEIDYPLAEFSSLEEILVQILRGSKKLGVVGLSDMPAPILERVKAGVKGLEIVDVSDIINELRLIKSPAEIACLRECGRIACLGYEKLMEAFGGAGVRVTTPDELRRAVNEAMDSGKPTLVNAVIDPAAGSESGNIGKLNPQSAVRKK